MSPIQDHPLRYELANELHARPFPSIDAPGAAVYLAIKKQEDAATRDRWADLAHLTALLDRFGAAHPQPGATHYFGQIGRHQLKWECHTEFVTYTIFGDGVADTPFDAGTFKMFPEDWLASTVTPSTPTTVRVLGGEPGIVGAPAHPLPPPCHPWWRACRRTTGTGAGRRWCPPASGRFQVAPQA